MYIALDLETTGVSSDRDKIIEAAAVKFNGTKIIATYETLVNPGIPIPDIASQITGIKDADVANAPSFDEVRDELAEFIGDAPIVGHFIQFDTDFLKANGIPLTNIEYDTFQLAGILLRGLPSYSLETISQLYDLDHTNKHRALDDSIAAIHLFNLLLSLINEIPESDRNQITNLLQGSSWQMKELFLKKHQNLPPTPNLITSPKSQSAEQHDLTLSEQKIFEHLSANSNLLIETELQADIIAAATKFATTTNQQVLISTPMTRKAIPEVPENATIIHPPQEYLSREKLSIALTKKQLTDSETTLLLKTILWLPNTTTGHKSEIKVYGEENQTWYEICCSAPNELPDEDGFFNDALSQSSSKKLIFTSHKQLAYSTTENPSLLPEVSHLIIDRADNFEKNAKIAHTSYFRFRTIETILQKFISSDSEASTSATKILDQFLLTMGLTGLFFDKFAAHQDYEKRVMISDEFATTPEWHKALESIKNTIALSKEFINNLDLNHRPTAYLAIPFINQIKNLAQIINNFSSNQNLTWIFNDEEYFGIQSVPISPLSEVSPQLQDKYSSIIISSESISINKNLDFTAEQLLLNTDNFTPEIHSKLPDNLQFETPPSIVSPNNKNYQDSCTEFIREHILNTSENTFIIMFSRKAIEQTYEALTLEAKDSGKHLFAQNLSGSQGKIFEKFKQTPSDTTIIGTRYFWQFTQFPDAPIQNLIIQKVPFEPIRDPWIVARGEQYQDSFNDFLLPRAIIGFKAMINKFLAIPGSPKKIYLLDTRVTNSNYGDSFINGILN